MKNHADRGYLAQQREAARAAMETEAPETELQEEPALPPLPFDAAFACAIGIEARRIRNTASKPARVSLKAMRNRSTLAAHHVRGLLDCLSDESMRVAASLALAALESIEQMGGIYESRELLEAAKEAAPETAPATQQEAA